MMRGYRWEAKSPQFIKRKRQILPFDGHEWMSMEQVGEPPSFDFDSDSVCHASAKTISLIILIDYHINCTSSKWLLIKCWLRMFSHCFKVRDDMISINQHIKFFFSLFCRQRILKSLSKLKFYRFVHRCFVSSSSIHKTRLVKHETSKLISILRFHLKRSSILRRK